MNKLDRGFDKFVSNPTADAYAVQRLAILAAREETFRAQDLTDLQSLLDQDRFHQVIEFGAQIGNNWLLCPRFHFLTGIAASELGDQTSARLSKKFMQACLLGILETGEGSQQRPYTVTYVSDEYDVVRVLQTKSIGQQLVESERGRFDVITCADESEIWFDVTDLLPSRPLSASELYEAHAKLLVGR